MYNVAMRELGDEPSPIRKLFAYGQARKQEIGDDKVFDYSIGNPSIPAPDAVSAKILELAQGDPVSGHAYTQSAGDPAVNQAIAEAFNRRFGTNYTGKNLYLTAGASAALCITLKALIVPGDEIITIPPFFPEYRTYINVYGGKPVEVLAREDDFQMDLPAIEAAINEHTKAIIINSPNNPVGVVYSRENLEGLAEILKRKSEEYGRPIFIMSDEPYRELVYDNLEVPWVPNLYDNTIVCYSWSKCLSLPGERMGFVLVPPEATESAALFNAVSGAGRALGYICAPALFQKVVAACADEPANIEAYEKNRILLTDMLDELGYTYVQPQGAFYLWMKALEPDEQAFSAQALKHELLLVPSTGFGVPGWVRLGYCIPEEVIRNSRSAFEALKKDYE